MFRRNSTIKLGHIFGVEVELDYSWIIVFLLVTWSLAAGFFPLTYPQFGRVTNLLLGIITAFFFFACVLIHELTHSVVAKRLGVGINKITLFLFGGVAQIEDEPQDAAVELKMAVAGPASSFVLALIFLIISSAAELLNSPLEIIASTSFLAQINFILAIFNLVPGFPLDGGRIFRAILWFFNKDLLKSTQIAVMGGQFFSYLLIFTGIIQVFFNNLGGLWLILIGFFLNQAAGGSLKQLEIKLSLSKTKIKDLISEVPALVSLDLNIKDLADDYFLKYNVPSFLVKDKGIVGIVKIEDLQKIPQEEWINKRVSDIVTLYKDEDFLLEKDPAFKALKLMSIERLDQLPVMSGKKLVGVITREGIGRFLILKQKT